MLHLFNVDDQPLSDKGAFKLENGFSHQTPCISAHAVFGFGSFERNERTYDCFGFHFSIFRSIFSAIHVPGLSTPHSVRAVSIAADPPVEVTVP